MDTMAETFQGTTEYSAVRNGGAGLIDLSSGGRVLVSGSEVVTFLNGLITNDMKTLVVNSWMPAAFPNVQGRLLAAVRVLHRDDGFLIDTESATHDTVLKLLQRFTLAGDFRVADTTAKMAMLSVQGKQAADIIRATLGEEAAKVDGPQVLKTTFTDNGQMTVIRVTHTAEDGYDLFLERDAAQTLSDALTSNGAKPVNEDVSQEIIARIKYRGHVAKKLAGLIFETDAELDRGAKILSLDDKEVGRVTSFAFSPNLARTIALGYLKYDYLAPGTKVKIVSAEREFPATVTELPFIRGSWYTK